MRKLERLKTFKHAQDVSNSAGNFEAKSASKPVCGKVLIWDLGRKPSKKLHFQLQKIFKKASFVTSLCPKNIIITTKKTKIQMKNTIGA